MQLRNSSGPSRWCRARKAAKRGAVLGVTAAVAGSTFVSLPAAFASDPVTAGFDYSMPKRFGQDENGDGKIDYFTGTSDEAVIVGGQEKQVDPDTWTVDLDACASTDGAALTWVVLDHPDPSHPLLVEQTGSGCADYRLTVPEEGTYRVALTATKDGVAAAPVVREVVVQDWLIVSIGDSYGSGEGVPDAPIPQDKLLDAQAKWNDAAAKLAAVASIQASFAPLNQRIAELHAHQAELAVTDCVAKPDRCAQLITWIAGDQLQIVGEYTKLGLSIVAETVDDVIKAMAATLQALEASWNAAVELASVVTGQLPNETEWQAQRCHRSANAGSAKAAKQLEDLDPRTSVTFVHLACSGASVVYGLLGLYEGAENAGVPNADCPDQADKCIPEQVKTAKSLIRDREVDAVYTSIGGNDAHFADLVKACIVQTGCHVPNNPESNVKEGLQASCRSLSGDPIYGLVSMAICENSFEWVPDFLARSGPELWEEGKNGDKEFPFDPMFKGHKALYELLDAALVQAPGNDATWLVPQGRENRVFISEYVDPLKNESGRYCDWATDQWKMLPNFDGNESRWVTETVSEELKANIKEAARVHEWTFVDGIFAGFTNRGYCADDHHLVRMHETFLNQGNYNGMVHPNDKGHEVYAENILSAWRGSLYAGGDLGAPRRPEQRAFADAGGPYTVDEGSQVALVNDSWDGDGDPISYAWGHDLGNDAALDSTTASTPTLTAVDDVTGEVTVSVSDEDSTKPGRTPRTDRAPVTVRNVAPTVTAGPAATVSEGVELTGTVGYTDPGTADTHESRFQFADDTLMEATPVSQGTAAWSHTWADEGEYAVTALIRDDDGGEGHATSPVTVTNAAPVVGPIATATAPVLLGTGITAAASFTDAGVTDTHTATWSWGDGQTEPAALVQTAGGGSVTGAHTYAGPGIYTVTLTVDDGDGGVTTQAYEYVVVYDPAGGFTTGAGWFESPAGAYTPGDATDPDVTGRANFGFQSKYQKGAHVPTGNTSFRFRAAGLEFDSTSYEWLVIAGERAQYKGAGTVNGQSGYRFILSGIDGDSAGTKGPDKLRIKIWSEDGTVVYDNQAGDKDDALASTVIGAGQIQVQGPKG